MVTLKTVQEKDKTLLRNVLQEYLGELSVFYEDLPDENGNCNYKYLDAYFTDPARTAYFIYADSTPVGFALLNPYSCCGKNPDYTMAEFAIFPAYRRKHLASDAVNEILESHPGNWEIKYNEKNIAAKCFWTTITAPFCPEKTPLNPEETVLSFTTEKLN